MSSKKEMRRAQRKKPEPDLSAQYRKIGIKAVAAASRAKDRDASGGQEEKKHAKEKANG